MKVRHSAKAVIIKDGNVLLTKNRDDVGDFYLFPGGGQEHGETLHNALERECLEEIGYKIDAGELLHLREYIGKNHEYADFDADVHQLEYYFLTTIDEESDGVPTNPDEHQIGVEWVDVNQLDHIRLLPNEMKDRTKIYVDGKQSPVYLGDVN